MTAWDQTLASMSTTFASQFSGGEQVSALIRLTTGFTVAYLVYRFARRFPWPRPFRFGFLAMHLVAAPLTAGLWLLLATVLEAVVPGAESDLRGFSRATEFLFLGSIFYTIIVGITNAVEASARAAQAEAIAARTQLAALRAQLHPHFLFNALHTVVQLIPVDPVRAGEAAELVADLLRTTLEEHRDEVTLGDEWRFVSRYLAVENIRFGERLVVQVNIPPHLLDGRVPAFALQTLVENAVHHGAAPRVAPTTITIAATATGQDLTLSVTNTGDANTPASASAGGPGTGLARLRERLTVLYGTRANLSCSPLDGGGFEAVMVVPCHRVADS